jgi:hypothetical protein
VHNSKRLLVCLFFSITLHCSFCLLVGLANNGSGMATHSTAKVVLTGNLTSIPKRDLDTESVPPDLVKRGDKEDERLTESNHPEKTGLSQVSALPVFYRTSELDSPPLLLGDYPEILSIDREETNRGKLVMEVWINNDGVVLRVVPIESTLPEYVMNEAMVQIGKLRFSPGLKAGLAVFVRFRLEFRHREPDVEEAVPAAVK